MSALIQLPAASCQLPVFELSVFDDECDVVADLPLVDSVLRPRPVLVSALVRFLIFG
jgi:hypothetical protein